MSQKHIDSTTPYALVTRTTLKLMARIETSQTQGIDLIKVAVIKTQQSFPFRNSCFGRFCPTFNDILFFKERRSGIQTPNFAELKRRCLILAKRRLYENELWGQTFKSTIFKCLQKFAIKYMYI